MISTSLIIKNYPMVNHGNRKYCMLPISWPTENNNKLNALNSMSLGGSITLFDEEEY